MCISVCAYMKYGICVLCLSRGVYLELCVYVHEYMQIDIDNVHKCTYIYLGMNIKNFCINVCFE